MRLGLSEEIEAKNVRSKKLTREQGNLVNGLFINAFEDYIAARLLLINGLLSQGCILANTAIEKYFKGMIAILGEKIPRHHDISVKRYQNTIKSNYRIIHKIINYEFIQFLAKTYKLRYLDEVEENFNLTIIKNKTLAELDYIVKNIEERFKITSTTKPDGKKMYEDYKDNKNPYLYMNNYYLIKQDKKQFIEQRGIVYEIRKFSNGSVMQMTYYTDEIIDDGKFIYEALKPKSEDPENRDFTFCFKSL